MCYDDQARPPRPPGATGSASGEDLVLTAADDNHFAAYAAHPEQPRSAQVLIYPDIRGLHQFYKDLALRFAEVGIAAVAMDYFGRTAGLTSRAELFEFRPHVEQMQVSTVHADARACLDYLRQGPGAEWPTFILGFCRGGSLSIYSAAQPFGLAGIVAFYAGLGRKLDEAQGTPVDVAPRIRCPVLGLFGGADAGIPPEHVAALDAALDQAGVAHEIVTYRGAPHGFFDRRAEEFAAESADAWQRLLRFMLPA
ncbi:MAG: dienelactone hydrolase family protein [Anaerolineales bacterium]|nr:dienelactone hydrolase family protein [Anaerolineales bacterium]